MLKLLRIDNFVLIDRVELVLDKGFTVITGETGSGKSILLAAINLLLGERADFSVIGKKSTKSFVEASFNMEDRFIDFFTANDLDQQPDILIRREIVKDGKSRAFINDTPVQLSKLKELTSLLLSVNSQFNTFDLRSSSYQMELYDDMADTTFMRMKFTHDFLAWKANCQVIRKLEEKRNLENSQKDYTQFLLDELSQLDLKNTDFSIYESALSRIENADSIREVALQMSHLSEDNGPYSTLSTLLSKIEKISLSDAKMTQFAAQLKAVLIELKEMMNEAEELVNDIEIDPEAHRMMLTKIDEFNRQLNKHRFTHQSQLVELENQLKDTTQESEQLDTELELLLIENESVHKKLVGLSQLLHENRIKAAKGIENSIKDCLQELKLSDTEINFQLSVSELKENGASDLSILFSANKGMVMTPIEKAASGGEMSRVMLALQKIISDKRKLPTVLFDEIDTGVSGEVAQKIGLLLRAMGENMQLIAISHLPQVAAKANNHFKVEKDSDGTSTKTYVKRLENEEVAIEIARLMSGEVITSEAILTAKNLMN
jgi:DNA repair protein RecN (Recombination protein N)